MRTARRSVIVIVRPRQPEGGKRTQDGAGDTQQRYIVHVPDSDIEAEAGQHADQKPEAANQTAAVAPNGTGEEVGGGTSGDAGQGDDQHGARNS